jgi:hypothetical protein
MAALHYSFVLNSPPLRIGQGAEMTNGPGAFARGQGMLQQVPAGGVGQPASALAEHLPWLRCLGPGGNYSHVGDTSSPSSVILPQRR